MVLSSSIVVLDLDLSILFFAFLSSFTFSPEDFLKCRKKFRNSEKKGYNALGERLSADERYSGRYFTHDFVFSEVDSANAHILNIPWYYDVSNWAGLKKWLGSKNKLDRPKEVILSYNEWNPLAIDTQTEEDELNEQK